MPSTITTIARDFFEACETGKGWDGCKTYCSPDASFSCQADTLADVTTLESYTEWMKSFLTPTPDGHYELKSFATDNENNKVCAVAVFHATHTGDGGPVPPTGKKVAADYAYDFEFNDGLIVHMTKIWNDDISLRQLGWA